MNDWYIVEFTEEEVAEAKRIRTEKDKNNWGDHFSSDTRWIGYLGEIAFKCWLEEMGMTFHHWDYIDRKDIRDFTVSSLEIDVKTVGTNYFPRESYGCTVAVAQLDNEVVNAYVFCRFILEERRAIVMGWIPKDEFIKLSKGHKKGERVNEHFVSPADMRQVCVRQLKPLIDIDRYRRDE